MPLFVASVTALAMLASDACFRSDTLTAAFGVSVLALFNFSKYVASGLS